MEDYINESNELEQYFYSNVDSLNFFINKQIDEISKFSQRIRNWENKNITLPIFSELTTKDIWKIDQERIYKLFVTFRKGNTQDKITDFINIRNSFYNIDKFIKIQNDLNIASYQLLTENIEIWNNNLKILIELSNHFVTEYNISLRNDIDEFLNAYTDLVIKKQRQLINENKSGNIEIIYNELIIPLSSIVNNKKYSKDKRIYLISTPLINLQKVYSDVKNIKYEQRKKILESGRRLLWTKLLINESIQKTKNREKSYN